MTQIAFERTRRNISRPAFIVDPNSIVRGTGRQIDWDVVDERYNHGAFQVEVSADAAADAVVLPVIALRQDVPKYTVIYFGADKYARVTADAEAGAVQLDVEALTTALVDGDIGYVDGDNVGGGHIPAGTWVDLLDNGKVVPSALNTGGGVTAYGILETNADELSQTDAASGYGVILGGAIYENLLPEADPATGQVTAAWKTEARARGGAFIFEQYEDDTV